MHIQKLIKQKNGHYFAVFDEIPPITYEKIGSDYIGTAVDAKGNIVASSFLKREPYGRAFGGQEIKLSMKNGTTETIQDYWFDYGPHPSHGTCVNIGAATLQQLQQCYVYADYSVTKDIFEQMVDEYLRRDKVYTYQEVREWCDLQHTWYNVIVNGKTIPFMMNRFGDMVEKETKKRVYAKHTVTRKVKGEHRTYMYFRFDYMENGQCIKIDAHYFNTLRDTLPFTEDEIRNTCMTGKSSLKKVKV